MAGKPFVLEPWQQAIVGNLFGWKRKDSRGRVVRRFRELFLFVPRKNGKTPLAAGICVFVLFCDGEPGAQIVSAAGDREQAALLFRQAKGMVEQEPELNGRATIYGGRGGVGGFRSIVLNDDPGSVYKVISADADTKHGGTLHLGLVDELHVQPNRDLVDTLATSTASLNRAQPLMIYITTSDYDRESICNEKYDEACKVRDGITNDPALLPVIYEASADDDWTAEKTWEKANPNLDVSVSREYLRREVQKARETPSYENTLKRLHLNIRTQNDVRWLSIEDWDKGVAAIDESKLLGRTCHGAIDLSNKIDVTAWVMLFPPDAEHPKWAVLPRFFVPEENAHKRERRDRVPYETWGRQGFVKLTPGNVIDYEYVKHQIAADAKLFNVQDIAFDPWNATQIALQLADSGANVVEFGQGFRSMSEPTKELEKIVTSSMIEHGNNPVLRWMAGNVTVETDPAGNLKPSKKKSTERIDGIVATVMALGRALLSPIDVDGPSVMVL